MTPLLLSELSKPAMRALKQYGIESLKDLSDHTMEEIEQLHGIGPKSMRILTICLAEEGLSFKPGFNRQPQSVQAYLASLSDDNRHALERVRKVILEEIPEVVEKISYQIPTFTYRNKPLIHVAAFKDHLSIIPVTKEIYGLLEKELKHFYYKGNTIRFTPKNQVPDEVLKKIVAMRKALIEG